MDRYNVLIFHKDLDEDFPPEIVYLDGVRPSRIWRNRKSTYLFFEFKCKNHNASDDVFEVYDRDEIQCEMSFIERPDAIQDNTFYVSRNKSKDEIMKELISYEEKFLEKAINHTEQELHTLQDALKFYQNMEKK